MKRTVRYQAAVLHDHHVLLLKVVDAPSGKTFWVIPGGGREAGESEETCIRREVLEETHLQVEAERLLLDEQAAEEDDTYQRSKTYVCRLVSGIAQPGIEPEVDTADHVTIREVRWFDLRNPAAWDELALNDPITYPLLQRLRSALGYAAK